MPDGNRNPGAEPPDPDQIAKLLEIELHQNRELWKAGQARRNALRAASFFFLFLVVIGALAACWYFLSPEQMSEWKTQHAPGATATPTPAATVAK